MTLDANTVLINMPHSIKAYTVANNDMTYTIVINARLNHESMLAAYKHEIDHILNNDFDKKCSANLIEFYAHKQKQPPTSREL